MCSLRKAIQAVLVTAGLLTGCRTLPPPTPEPAAEYIGVDPAYAELAYAWLAGFADQDPLHELTLQVLPTTAGLAAVESGELAFMITSGKPPLGWFITPLTQEVLLVSTSPGVVVREFDMAILKDIFTGRISDWSEIGSKPGPITPIIYPAGGELRLAIERQVLGNSRVTSNALLAPDPVAMAELLGQEPGAIGILPGFALPSGLKPLALAGIQPSRVNVDSGRYAFTVDILALAPDEPVGLARSWLVWIQSQSSRPLP